MYQLEQGLVVEFMQGWCTLHSETLQSELTRLTSAGEERESRKQGQQGGK